MFCCRRFFLFDQFFVIRIDTYFKIWTNTFCNLDKYICQFGLIYLSIWTNIFVNLDKYSSAEMNVQSAQLSTLLLAHRPVFTLSCLSPVINLCNLWSDQLYKKTKHDKHLRLETGNSLPNTNTNACLSMRRNSSVRSNELKV